jgi:multidrug efflux pump subunit AcrA (membrane-fusion protein)
MAEQKHKVSTSVPDITVPRFDKVIVWVLIALIISIVLILHYTPWIQSGYGTGTINTLQPQDRAQPISALVPGQIKVWHVKEGDQLKQGDPIVTLVDIDEGRVDKLTAQLSAIKQRRNANSLALSNSEKNMRRQQALLKEGLVSRLDSETAQNTFQSLRAQVAKTEEDFNTVNMALSRQSIQTTTAPKDGIITRLIPAGLSSYVKPGDLLGYFIPDGVERSVEIKVSGLDAALIRPKQKARLLFDGWPAFQISGWPNSSVGTFGGEVTYIDPVADPQGRFTIWIKPDKDDTVWPSENSVRLGSRVRAWVLMQEVTLGYELWRQLNNFPPENSPMPAGGEDAKL